jgi:hypothetical protein
VVAVTDAPPMRGMEAAEGGRASPPRRSTERLNVSIDVDTLAKLDALYERLGNTPRSVTIRGRSISFGSGAISRWLSVPLAKRASRRRAQPALPS